MKRFAASIIVSICAAALPAAPPDDAISAAAHYLDAHLVYTGGPAPALKSFEPQLQVILQRPDPMTSFSTFIYGVQRKAAKLLTPDQAARWQRVVDERSPAHQRLHDERNTIRCRWVVAGWEYAMADEAAAPAKRAELQRWLDLRLAWMLQEQAASTRFDAAIWEILTAEQRSKVLGGEWDSYAKKSTGHSRGFFSDRVVVKALGKATDRAGFDRAVTERAAMYAPLLQRYTETETISRRVEFALDMHAEPMVLAAFAEVSAAFGATQMADLDAQRAICRAGYDMTSPAVRQKVADAIAEVRREAITRYPQAEALRQTLDGPTP